MIIHGCRAPNISNPNNGTMSDMKSDVFGVITDCSKHSDWKGTLTLEGNVYLSNEIVSSQSKVGGVSFCLTAVKGPLDIFKVLTEFLPSFDE